MENLEDVKDRNHSTYLSINSLEDNKINYKVMFTLRLLAPAILFIIFIADLFFSHLLGI